MPQTKPTYASLNAPFLWSLSFIKGASIPCIALIFAVLIALGLGVMAAEDWDGFANRINLSKTIAFYISIAFGALLFISAKKTARQKPHQKAQITGLTIVLILWLALL